jgi:hypothetical protein
MKLIDKNVPLPVTGECEFERDRRVFFQSFPGVKTFQLFDDSENKNKVLTKQFHIKYNMPNGYILRLEELNEQKTGIYMCINETNGKGRKTENIVSVRACFADFDGVSIKPIWEYDPSMVIETSPGKYHIYWFSDNIPLEGFRQLQESIAEKFKSDPKIKDLPRVMRVPGFYHQKDVPFLVKIIHYSGMNFDFTLLTKMFPPTPKKKWSAPKYQQPQNYQNAEFKGQYGASSGSRNCHITKRIGGMIKNNLPWSTIENEAFKEGAACNPPLSVSEIRSILKSMRRYS